MNVMMVLFVIAMLGFMGCGGGGSESIPLSATTASSIEHVGWYFDNAASDYTSSGATCLFNFFVYYSGTIAEADIESFGIIAPTGASATIPAANGRFGTSSSGKHYISTGLHFTQSPNTFPLAGTWTASLKLKDGTTSSLQFTLHEPGSSVAATHQYLYTKEDWTPSTDPAQYVAALGRFPSQGYTIQYSTANGGEITSAGLAAARANFLSAEPKAFNMFCWLFDAGNNYLGYTTAEYSTSDHSRTGLITAAEELLITPASTVSSTGNGHVDLSTVKSVRFVYLDGAQYAPSSYAAADQRSISALVAVN